MISYTGSEIINVHKTKEQREHNKTLFPNPNQNNNSSFVLRHLSPVHESLPQKSLTFNLTPGRQTFCAALRQSVFPIAEVAHFYTRKGDKRRLISHQMVKRLSYCVEVEHKR